MANSWRDGCLVCGKCTKFCSAQARRFVGSEFTVDQLLENILEDLAFYKGTNGGITFSGGEPLAQPDFIFACANILRAKDVHVAVETSGFWPTDLSEELINTFDLILFDLKHVNKNKFMKTIGKDNKNILLNLKLLLDSAIPIELHITLIPEFNDASSDLVEIANWLKKCSRIPQVKLLPFHRLATAKEKLFNRIYPLANQAPTTEDQLNLAIKTLRDEGIPVII